MANTTTSKTGSVSSHVTTWPINGHQGAIQIAIQYTKGDGTSIALSPIEYLIPDLDGTNWYKVPATDASGSTLSAYTLTLNATGNYFITFIYVPINAKKARATVAYTGGSTQATQIDCYTDFE